MIPREAIPELPSYPRPEAWRRLWAMGTSLALVAGLLGVLGPAGRSWVEPRGLAQQTLSVLLREGRAPRYEPAPEARPGPAGGSNRLGTGSIDPGLLKLPSPELIRTPPPALPDPLAVGLPETKRPLDFDRPALPSPLVVDRSLPVRMGGNGAFAGDGEGFGRGHGNGVGDGSGGGAQGGIRLLKSVSIVHHGQRGDPPLQGQTVKVRLWIGADGIPLDAEVLSGPARVQGEVRQAALDWRFQVPAHLKAQAPLQVIIDFRFKTVRER